MHTRLIVLKRPSMLLGGRIDFVWVKKQNNQQKNKQQQKTTKEKQQKKPPLTTNYWVNN